jgi:hypothetical protein
MRYVGWEYTHPTSEEQKPLSFNGECPLLLNMAFIRAVLVHAIEPVVAARAGAVVGRTLCARVYEDRIRTETGLEGARALSCSGGFKGLLVKRLCAADCRSDVGVSIRGENGLALWDTVAKLSIPNTC